MSKMSILNPNSSERKLKEVYKYIYIYREAT